MAAQRNVAYRCIVRESDSTLVGEGKIVVHDVRVIGPTLAGVELSVSGIGTVVTGYTGGLFVMGRLVGFELDESFVGRTFEVAEDRLALVAATQVEGGRGTFDVVLTLGVQ